MRLMLDLHFASRNQMELNVENINVLHQQQKKGGGKGGSKSVLDSSLHDAQSITVEKICGISNNHEPSPTDFENTIPEDEK